MTNTQKTTDRRQKLTDREVELIRTLHEDPHRPMSLTQLALRFEVSHRHIARICAYAQR